MAIAKRRWRAPLTGDLLGRLGVQDHGASAFVERGWAEEIYSRGCYGSYAPRPSGNWMTVLQALIGVRSPHPTAAVERALEPQEHSHRRVDRIPNSTSRAAEACVPDFVNSVEHSVDGSGSRSRALAQPQIAFERRVSRAGGSRRHSRADDTPGP